MIDATHDAPSFLRASTTSAKVDRRKQHVVHRIASSGDRHPVLSSKMWSAAQQHQLFHFHYRTNRRYQKEFPIC
ncbi:unnamed protein product [Gongylonema pulchrum]|uniref:Uncharacterized protein n=1 Tax=Gongylonema pulchrum TaxID=637853 RepID=A0A183DRG4_9BILA|nr:unnamed protein product [Gongylonema pulchrum]